MADKQTKKESGITDAVFVSIYRAIYEEFATSDAPFQQQEAANLVVSKKITAKMLGLFLQQYCSEVNIEDTLHWKLDLSGNERAVRLEKEIGLVKEKEKESEVHMTPPSEAEAHDLSNRPDGLPRLARRSRYGASMPGIDGLSVSPKAKVVEVVEAPVSEEINDPGKDIREMPSDELMEAYGHYRSVNNEMLMKMAENELRHRGDLKDNKFFVPGEATFKGVRYKEITNVVRRNFFHKHEHIFLEADMYDHLRDNRNFNLDRFVHALVSRKLQKTLKWEPQIRGKPHNVALLVSEDEENMVFVKCTPKE